LMCALLGLAPAVQAQASPPAAHPSAAGLATHCLVASPGADVAAGCTPALPLATISAAVAPSTVAPVLDRGHAYYVGSGCGAAVDADPVHARVFDHLTAGVGDAVVFGAGVEYGVACAVDALLRRRVRTHVALDAAAAVDDADAQAVIADWKRRGVDGATVATLARLLARGSQP